MWTQAVQWPRGRGHIDSALLSLGTGGLGVARVAVTAPEALEEMGQDLARLAARKGQELPDTSVLLAHVTLSGKELVCQCRRDKRHQFNNPWVGKTP